MSNTVEAVKQIKRVLAPWFCWNAHGHPSGNGSFRVVDYDGPGGRLNPGVMVVDTIAHELGHLFHLVPTDPVLLHDASVSTEITKSGITAASDPLGAVISRLALDEQVESEICARATNLLIAQMLGRKASWLVFWKRGTFADPPALHGILVEQQAATPRTQRIAHNILGILLAAEIDLGAK